MNQEGMILKRKILKKKVKGKMKKNPKRKRVRSILSEAL